jgi:hypothetical protein
MSYKIACCISGYPSASILTHINKLSTYLPNVDFFIFLWNTINPEMKAHINNVLKPVDIQYQELFKFSYDAKYKEPDKQEHKNNALSMFYGISQVQNMRKQYEQKTNKKYDIVIRFRYDIYFIDNFKDIIFNVKRLLDNNTLVFPFDHQHIGLCDQIWFGKSEVMDQFIFLSNWIKENISTLFFVNESVLYNFIYSRKINFKCTNIRYLLLRDHLLYVPTNFLYDEFVREQTEPWITACPEKKEGLYQKYIHYKNVSATTIYFLSNQCYCEIPCKLLNVSRNKYLYVMSNSLNIVSNKTKSSMVVLSNFYTTCKIRLFNAYLINIFIDIETKEQNKQYCLSVHDNKLICSSNPNNLSSQFFLLKKNNSYQFVYHRYSNLNRLCQISNYNFFIHVDKINNIRTTGEEFMRDSEWNIIPL